MSQRGPEARYPELFSEMFWPWGPITAQFLSRKEAPPSERIAQVRLVPFVDDKVVVIDKGEGQWDHPGGTLEPGESWQDAMAREAMEEAGATILSHQVFGSLECVSHNSEPYRAHLPYPEFSQVVVFGEVDIVSSPVESSDNEFETIRDVVVVSLDEAVRRLSQRHDGLWQAQMYALAAELRSAFK